MSFKRKCTRCKEQWNPEVDYCPNDGTRLGPATLDRYELVRSVAQSGMSEVYEAKHVHTGRRVAVKLLHSTLAFDEDMSERLHREGRATSAIGDPNIVDVTDFGSTDEGSVYMVMEWIEGSTLREVLEAGPVAPAIALDIVAQVAQGLASAHLIGIIHRDVKPENIMVFQGPENSLRVKILDFGVAKLATAGQPRLTRTGTIVGTPAYISPEQARGLQVDERTDIYSLGCILYELITDTQLYRDCSPMEMVLLHAKEVPELPSLRAPEKGIPPALDDTIMRCIEKDKELRFPSMAALKDTLRNLQRQAVPQLEKAEEAAANTFIFESRDAVRLANVARAARASSQPVMMPEPFVPEVQPGHWRATAILLGAIALVATVTAVLLTRGPQSSAEGNVVQNEEQAIAPGQLASDTAGAKGAEQDKAGKDSRVASAEDPKVGDATATGEDKERGEGKESGEGIATGEGKETGEGIATGEGKETGEGIATGEGKETGEGKPGSKDSWQHQRQHSKFYIGLKVSPRPLLPREPIELKFKLSDFTGKLSWAITEGRLRADVQFVHFVSHDTLGSLSAPVEDTGTFGVIFSVPRSGKYHLMMKFKDGAKVVGRTQMDICVGIDPDAPDVESLCPHLNEYTGHHGAAR